MLKLSNQVSIPLKEIEFTAIRSQGAGGQNVNKVSTAIQLRFDINASSLPEFYKEKLLALSDQRVTNEGIIIIKAQKFRTQEKNKEDALNRLKRLIKRATIARKKRRTTKPSHKAKQKRLDNKNKRSKLKTLRKKVPKQPTDH